MANDLSASERSAPTALEPEPRPGPAATSRRWVRIWVEIRKALIPALITGALGYVGAFIMPPSVLYDILFRQNVNDLGGLWLGGVAGAPATLMVTDDGRNLKGTLTLRVGLPESRAIEVVGNHDSLVVLTGEWDAGHELRIGLARKVGERYGADDAFLMLMPVDEDSAYLVCSKDSLDSSDPKACRSLGKGATFFARKRGDPK